MTFSHYLGVKEDLDPLSVIDLKASYHYRNLHSIEIFESFTKLYVVDGEQSEVQPADFLFYYKYRLSVNPIYGWDILTHLGGSLPLSAFSRRHGIVTKLNFSFSFSRFLWAKRLNISFSPQSYAHWNRFKTTISNPGDNGGRPLIAYKLGFLLSSSVKILKDLNFEFSTTWYRNYYEVLALKNAFDPYGNETNPPNHSYSFTASLSYQWKKAGLSLGFIQRNIAETLGGVEVVLLDVEKSYYLMSFNYQI